MRAIRRRMRGWLMEGVVGPRQFGVSDEDWLSARLPDEIHSRLSPDLKQAIAQATRPRPWDEHPVDIRVSIPLPFARYYLALVAGPERRPVERRKAERRARGLITAGNVMFVMTIVVGFYGVLGLAALLLTQIIE
jgi:hypothetical protein